MSKQKLRTSTRIGKKKTLIPRAIVGIGASAGGLEAVTELLENLPKKTGMGFVYVQHLDPTHKSLLASILSRISSIPVLEARQGTRVESDHFYVIPPGKNMSIKGGVLRLVNRVGDSGRLVSIDNFFRSLASDQKNRSIGVVLSGNASDGVLGLEAIKREGGITFAQDEKSAKHPSMPHGAILSGAADLVLAPAYIARELGVISRHPKVAPLKTMTQGSVTLLTGKEDESLLKIFTMLQTQSGVNFSLYKTPTMKRRIARRMVLRKIDTLPEYATHLQEFPEEIEALFRDLLIHVTEFFRDREVFDHLKKFVFPALLEKSSEGESLRIWSAGCSTGEEAYSLAICLVEFLEKTKQKVPFQIFGTDLSESSILKARAGIYPMSIAANVSPERLRRFFTVVDGRYQISKAIRDVCTFAKQNLISDPPFSQLDLIACRNVLIYLEPAAQKRVLPIFHYALKPTGFLVLGKSESIGGYTDLFLAKYKTLKIYAKKASPRSLHFRTFFGEDLNTQKKAGDVPHSVDRILKLEQEVATMKERLHATPTKGRGADEQFRAAVEGVSSFNEELQTTNEELETAKEELQSTNEELVTVNEELQTRNVELDQTNNDITNVLDSANVPIIIVDRGLRIRRLTLAAEKSLRIIPSDIGRSIADIRLPIRFPNLRGLLLDVMGSALPRHEEVEDEEGRFHTLWVRPYKTRENKVDGAVITLIDIDEIKKGKSELEQTLSYAQGILGTMREPLLVLDENLRIKTANHAFYTMFSDTAKDVEGALIYELKNSRWDTSRLREALEKILPQKSSFNDLEITFDFPGIGSKIMLFNGRRLLQNERGEEMILLAMQDITEQAKAVELGIANKELAFQNDEKEKRAAELIIANKELAFQNDEKEKRAAELIIANKELVFQNKEKEKRAAELVIANKELVFQTGEKEKRAAELVIADIELAFQNSEKEKRAAELVIANKELAFQAKLEQTLSYAQAILGTMREPLLVLDKNLRVKSANEAFYTTFSITAKDTEGTLVYELKNRRWDTPQLREALEKILPQKSAFNDLEITFDFPVIGSKVMLLNGRSLIQSEKGEELILLAMQDITEQRILQQRNDSFMSMASHELKTPVTTIKTLVQILQAQYEKSGDKTLIEYLTTIGQQIEQLTKLVVDLLDVSKIKADKFELEEKTFDFDSLTAEIVKSCQLLSPQHVITVQGKTHAQISGDRNSISRVFINLITNAIKYSPKADTINIKLSHTEKVVRVGIKDFGIGVAKTHQDKIFDRFFQVGNESGQSFAGLGIGLYITAAIVAQHRGRIWVESTEGKGSTFFFELPIQKSVEKKSHARS